VTAGHVVLVCALAGVIGGAIGVLIAAWLAG
jgi:hypothetical protein